MGRPRPKPQPRGKATVRVENAPTLPDMQTAIPSPNAGTPGEEIPVGEAPPGLNPYGVNVQGQESPSRLSGLTVKERLRVMVGFLEECACRGDRAAAAEVIRHYRWERELKLGRPGTRELGAGPRVIKVIDDVSLAAAAGAALGVAFSQARDKARAIETTAISRDPDGDREG